MKYLLIILILFLTGCQTVHKAITDTQKTVDSSSLVHKDTTAISLESVLNDSIAMHGIDITVNYANSDSFRLDSPSLESIISHPQRVGNVSSIHIHIDSLSNKKVTDIKKDSTTVKSFTKADVKTSTEVYSKVVSKTGISIWIYLAAGLVILVTLTILYLKKIIKL